MKKLINYLYNRRVRSQFSDKVKQLYKQDELIYPWHDDSTN